MRKVVCLLALTAAAWAQVPSSRHIWIITEENHSYEQVIGNASMPYFNWLASKYALADQYYSPQHSSLTALMWIVAGQQVTNDNNTQACFAANNVVRQLLAAGLTWKSYQEDLPYAGFQGLNAGNYVRRHNPLIDFKDSCAASQVDNSVPYSQLAVDMAKNQVPNFVYITPNLQNDAHDGSLAHADTWLENQVPQILARPEFKAGGDGILFIVWDEGGLGDTDDRCSARIKTGCGGRIATLVVGPQVRSAYHSPVLYTHPNLLHTVCDAMKLKNCPRAGALAASMTDVFNRVLIATPSPNAEMSSPVHVQATVDNDAPVYAMQVYVDNVLKYQVAGDRLDTSVAMSNGSHNVVVQSWDEAGGIHKSSVQIGVRSAAAFPGQAPAETAEIVDPTGAPNQGQITITSPKQGANLPSPVRVWSFAQDPAGLNAMQVYVDNVLTYEMTGHGVDLPLNLPGGTHDIVLQAWNAAGSTYKKAVTINVLPIKVEIAAPSAGNARSPVAILASAKSDRVIAMQAYVDNDLQYQTSGNTLNTSLSMGLGLHRIVVKAWDENGGTWTSEVDVNVQ